MTALTRRGAMLAAGALAACRTPDRAPQDAPWSRADAIVRAIRRTRIPNRTFAIAAYGATRGGDARPAILSAIAAAHDAGGGRVVIPEGAWRSDGPIHLQSNVALHLEEGAHLRFSPDPAFYLPVVLTRWEGVEAYTYSPFIYARGQTNIALTGAGTIDGQGEAHWLPWRREQRADQTRLRDMGRDGVPVAQRVFGAGARLRPPFVQFFDCSLVLVEGLTVRDSPFWLIHPVYCSDVIVRNVRAVSRHINSDGVDPDSCRRVLIEGCDFDVGDDGVAIKAGRDQDGWRVNRPSEDIVVRACRYTGATGGGVAVGSEMSGGVRNVFIENIDLARAHHALYFKANLDRGGVISDIHIRNVRAAGTDTVLIFTNAYHSYRGGQAPPRFERVTVADVTCARARVGVHILGHEAAPVRDVTVRNLTIGSVDTPLEARHAENLVLDGMIANGRIVTPADAAPPGAYRP